MQFMIPRTFAVRCQRRRARRPGDFDVGVSESTASCAERLDHHADFRRPRPCRSTDRPTSSRRSSSRPARRRSAARSSPLRRSWERFSRPKLKPTSAGRAVVKFLAGSGSGTATISAISGGVSVVAANAREDPGRHGGGRQRPRERQPDAPAGDRRCVDDHRPGARHQRQCAQFRSGELLDNRRHPRSGTRHHRSERPRHDDSEDLVERRRSPRRSARRPVRPPLPPQAAVATTTPPASRRARRRAR